MSLQVRLLFIMVLTIFIGMSLTLWTLFKNTQAALAVEMASSMQLAKELMATAPPQENFRDRALRMNQFLTTLSRSRYVDVQLMSIAGDDIIKLEPQSQPASTTPSWFSRLMTPNEAAIPQLIMHGSTPWSNPIIIKADPSESIAQTWKNTYPVLGFSVLLAICSTSILSYVIKQALAPLQILQQGFVNLMAGDFATTIATNGTAELRPIQQQFNHMASVLASTMEDNRLLAQQIMQLQEQERQEIARELHDEMGPLFFGIKVDIRLIERALQQAQYNTIAAHVTSLQQVITQLQERTRGLLQRLHPIALQQQPLAIAITQLIHSWRSRMKTIDWQYNIDTSAIPDSLQPTLQSTIYRVAQEALTNIARHAKASQAMVSIQTQEAKLIICIEDNGIGLPSVNRNGLGLIGMRERVMALGGTLALNESGLGGLSLQASIPIITPAD